MMPCSSASGPSSSATAGRRGDPGVAARRRDLPRTRPGSASGTVVLDDFEYQGTPIEGLTLTFANGRMTAMNASAGVAAIQPEYDAAPAGKDLFGAFDIGLNPGVQATPENRLRTWVAAGIVTVGIGDDSWAGGSNRVLYGLYGHIVGATVTVDGTPIVENGRLVN